MRPQILLDPGIVTQNFAAWQKYAGVPVRPVLKSDAYNWGLPHVIAALDASCESYCVGDYDELRVARNYTKHPIVVLGSIPLSQLALALDIGAIPTICAMDEIETIEQWSRRSGRKARVRIGVLPAAGWSAIDLSAIEELAPALAAANFEIEVWSHVTDPPATQRLQSRLAQAVHSIRSPGGRVVGTDLASTYSLAASGPMGTTVRIGVGLFGSTGGAKVPGVRCALKVVAPVVKTEVLRAGTKVGYGQGKMEKDGLLLTVRCGYADGLPKGLAESSDILSVGMQYALVRAPREPFESATLSLLDAATDLDAFALSAGTGAHEIVTAFGNAKTSSHVLSED
ncbi:MAG: hypothetical protein NVS9B12_05940 [Vulcanimicrobiaceae bacterium]